MDIETSMPTEKADLEKQQRRVLKQAGLGLRLKTAREATRLSEKDAALRLHLTPRMIEIMETEDFDNGPPATFMRGYLRSYARILNIPEEEINAAVAHLESNLPQTPQPAAPPILNTRNMHEDHQHLRRMTYLVITLLVVLVTMWWVSHPKDTIILTKQAAPAVTPATAVTTAPVVATPAPEATAPTAITATPESPAATDSTAPAAVTVTPQAAPTAPSVPDVQTNTAQPPVTATAPTAPVPTTPASPPTATTTAPAIPSSPVTAPNQVDAPVNVEDMNMARPEPGLDDDDY